MVYRIEDAAGRVLRRINNARNGQDALLRHWRIIGLEATRAVLAAPRQHKGAAMAARRSTPTGRGPELPFEVPEAAAARRPPAASRRGPSSGSTLLQDDLFALPPPPQHAPEVLQPQMPEPAEPPAEVPQRLDAALLQRVDYRTVSPADRPDAYLYHVATAAKAQDALRDGFAIDRADPLVLTERNGVPYWLSVLAGEDEGSADIAVLRLRRIAVDGMLEADPDSTSSAGCMCWLLTGSEV